jgi:hypothetical protein
MADIKWPTKLRGFLISNYSREETVGFREGDLTSGPSFVEPFSDDTPYFHNVTLQLRQSDARVFQAWLKAYQFKLLSPEFAAPLLNEDGETITQDCRFTSDGYPQLQSVTVGGVYTYNAKLIAREHITIDDGYEQAILTMYQIGDGDIDWASSVLDQAVNL